MLARKELNEENEVIVAKSLDGTKKKKRANKPNEFVTNDDFCPNCGLRLKNMPEDDNNFWTEVFQRELRDSDDPAAMMAMGGRGGKPGVLLFRGWGLESRTGAEAQTQMATHPHRYRRGSQEARARLSLRSRRARRSRSPSTYRLRFAAIPENLGPEVPRHFLSMLSPGEPKPFTKGSGRLELAEEILKQPIAMRVIVNRIWKGHFGTGIVDTPSNFGITGERPTNPDLSNTCASSFVEERHVRQEAASRDHAELGLPALQRQRRDSLAKDSGNRSYWRFDRKRLEAEQLRDAVLMRLRQSRQSRWADRPSTSPRHSPAAPFTAKLAATSWTSTCNSSTSRRRISAPKSASRPPYRCSACS